MFSQLKHTEGFQNEVTGDPDGVNPLGSEADGSGLRNVAVKGRGLFRRSLMLVAGVGRGKDIGVGEGVVLAECGPRESGSSVDPECRWRELALSPSVIEVGSVPRLRGLHVQGVREVQGRRGLRSIRWRRVEI